MIDLFAQCAGILLVCLTLGFLARRFHQPVLIGYIVSGILVGPLVLNLVRPGDSLEVFSSLGVSFLLFMVGLGLNPSYVREVGKVAIITGVAQVVITGAAGLALAISLGYPVVPALYLGIAYSFSSTIVVLRLLQEREEQDSLYGRIAIGFLLVQDLVAMAIFLFLSSTASTLGWGALMGGIILKIGVLLLLSWVFVRFLLPRLERLVGQQGELVFLFSVTSCFCAIALFQYFGFSRELGALTAGVLLSFSPVFRAISSRIQPLRDFFLIIFFVFVGANIAAVSIWPLLPTVLAFSAFILIVNPLIVWLIMLTLGYTAKTSFLAGLTVAQISEFSIIMMGIGVRLGQISPDLLTITTLVGLVTIAGCSYLVTHGESLFKKVEPLFHRFHPQAPKRDRTSSAPVLPSQEVLLFGAHRLGGGILQQLQDEGTSYLVIDFDPHLVADLEKRHVPVLFGEANDAALLDSLDMSRVRLVISTIPDFEINRFLGGYLRQRKTGILFVAVAHHQQQAKNLYAAGASYVVMPPYLGRRFVVDLFKKNLFETKKYASERARHLQDLASFVE